MALDWDNIIIKTDEYSYSLDAEQRMIIFEGQPGGMGPSGGVTIGSVETLPAGSPATVTNTGTFSSAILNFGIPKGADGDGSGNAQWGHISGTLSNQTDISNALDGKADATSVYSKTEADTLLSAKANTSDLGDMATEDDAPSDGSQYARKDGQWAVVAGGGGGGTSEWGDITGTLSDQTDLQAALDSKADLDPIAQNVPSNPIDGIYFDPTYNKYVKYDSGMMRMRLRLAEILNSQLRLKPNRSEVYDKTDVNTMLSAKANTADLGDLASEDDAPSDGTQYARKNGEWDAISTPAWGAITGTLANQTDLQNALNAKQGTLTFDSAPTAGSTNPVTSDGIKSAVDAKANAADVYSKTQADALFGLADTGWISLEKDSTYLDTTKGNLKYRKIGDLVEVVGGSLQFASDSTRDWVLLGQLPIGYRPTMYTAASCIFPTIGVFVSYVHTNGNLFVYKGTAEKIPGATNLFFNAVFLIGGQ